MVRYVVLGAMAVLSTAVLWAWVKKRQQVLNHGAKTQDS